MRCIAIVLCLATLTSVCFASCPYMGAPGTDEAASSGCPFATLTERKDPNSTEVHTISSHMEAQPDKGQMTVQGCECESSCGASISDGFNCDWCLTKDNCGTRGFSGSYDYCVYPDTPAFEKMSFQDKNTYFQSQIDKDHTRAAAYPSVSVMLTESSQTSFWDYKDEMPAGRVKGIHSIGAVCQFTLDIDSGSPYTGLFASGPQHGFVRMGGATTWDKSTAGYPPGLGIKFSRSGVSSGSYVALNTLDAVTWNFMGLNFSNHIPAPASVATKLLVKKFQQASQCPSQVGLSDMATWAQDGQKVDSPKFPFKLFIVPSAEVQKPNKPKSIDDVMADLESFKAGTKLFTVYACGKGNGDAELAPTAGGVETACGDPFKLGDMVTTTDCTTSAYGDAKFFIRHQPIEQDWKLRPDFLKQYPAKAACAWSTDPTPDGEPRQCATPKSNVEESSCSGYHGDCQPKGAGFKEKKCCKGYSCAEQSGSGSGQGYICV